mgnify:CR=1 FL=1
MKRIKTILILFLVCLTAKGEDVFRNDNDSIRLSLLTCAPGEEIYSYFGHTAIRYEDPGKGIDVVFNYGLFNFGAPNFIFRFALGQTIYWEPLHTTGLQPNIYSKNAVYGNKH